MSTTYDGGYGCGKIRYRLSGRPLIVNCCHCTYCQRESGSAFAVNAFYESDRMHLTTDAPLEVTAIPAKSGKPQHLHRCPDCKVVLWSLYNDNGDYIRVVKVGTLHEPSDMPPDVHIYTSTQQPWVKLSDRPTFSGPPKQSEIWPKESLNRLSKVVQKMKADRKAKQPSSKSNTVRAKL